MPIVAAIGPALAAIGGGSAAAGAALAGGALAAGGSIYAANQASNANQAALNAQQSATQQQIAAQQQAFNTINQNNAPFMQTGVSALQQLASQFGLGTPQAASGNYSTSQGAQTASQYDIPAYISQNADVQSRIQELQNSGVIGANGQWKSPEDWVASVQLPNAVASGEQRNFPKAAITTTQTPNAPGSGQNFGPTVAPRATYTRPGLPNLSAENYRESPGYQNRLREAGRTTNANFAARGLLGSGAAATEFGRRMGAIADEDYNNWVNQQMGLYDRTNSNFQNDRAYDTSVYDADRNYLTNRFDTNVSNLFNLVGIGQNAASNSGNNAQNYANNMSNIYGNSANSLSNYYGAQANNQGGLAGNLVGVGTNLLGNLWPTGGNSYSVPNSLAVSGDTSFNGLY